MWCRMRCRTWEGGPTRSGWGARVPAAAEAAARAEVEAAATEEEREQQAEAAEEEVVSAAAPRAAEVCVAGLLVGNRHSN